MDGCDTDTAGADGACVATMLESDTVRRRNDADRDLPLEAGAGSARGATGGTGAALCMPSATLVPNTAVSAGLVGADGVRWPGSMPTIAMAR